MTPRGVTERGTQELTRHEVDVLAVSAVRYALGRQTYIVSDVARLVADLDMSEKMAVVIARDVDRALREGRAGAHCDRAEWASLRDLIVERWPAAIDEIRRDSATFPGDSGGSGVDRPTT